MDKISNKLWQEPLRNKSIKLIDWN
jgi:hypothetical protein